MNDIGNMTFDYMNHPNVVNDNPDVAALAIELWCTIIEEE